MSLDATPRDLAVQNNKLVSGGRPPKGKGKGKSKGKGKGSRVAFSGASVPETIVDLGTESIVFLPDVGIA